MKFLKPTKKKIIISIIPFIPVMLMSAFMVEIPLSIPLVSVLLIIQLIIMVISYGAILVMAFPFQLILIRFGMWEYKSSLFIATSGPDITTGGMILTASFYAIFFYLLMSFLSYRKEKLRISKEL